ncbi:MAG: FecR domain-containing protein, partial [Verrucomicrobiota bacterium]
MTSPLRTGIVALIAIAFSTADSWAAKGAVKVTGARLTLADKKVSVAGQPVASGTAVAPGETVVTGRGSHAELTLPDGTVIRIGQGSSFTYAGSKLVLNQGTALVRVAHKNTTVVSGSRTYSGGPAVVSMQAAKGSDGLYILQGTGKVNGASLIAGQSSVLDHGKDRTFTFDLQKLEGSSALVTKFPQTPWIAQAQSLATIQHQLLTTKITPTDKPGKGAPAGISPSVATRDIVSSGLASQIGAGAGGRSVAFQVTGSPVSLGANATAFIKSAAIASSSGGTLTLNSSSGGMRCSSFLDQEPTESKIHE